METQQHMYRVSVAGVALDRPVVVSGGWINVWASGPDAARNRAIDSLTGQTRDNGVLLVVGQPRLRWYVTAIEQLVTGNAI